MTIARMKFEINALVEEMLNQIPDEVWKDPTQPFWILQWVEDNSSLQSFDD